MGEKIPRRLRVSFHIPHIKKPVGLGDVIKKGTSALGLKHCGKCQQRAQALNSMVTFKPRTQR